MHNPHYLKGETKNKMGLSDSFVHIDDVPIVALDNATPLQLSGLPSSDSYLRQAKMERERHKKTRDKKRRKKKHRKGAPVSDSDEDEHPPMHQVSTAFDLPEGAAVSDEEGNASLRDNDPHSQLDINLDEPLRDDEILPVRSHRIVDELSASSPLAEEDRSESKT